LRFYHFVFTTAISVTMSGPTDSLNHSLDSRQRKKLHTEKLEEEKKHYTHTISQLEDMLSSLQKREAELIREKSEWIAQQQQITTYLESMHMEKDEMIRRHTLETAELRKKNNILLETVEKLERGGKTTMADQAQAHVQTADFTGFENLSMDTGPWDEFGMANGLSIQDTTVPASHSLHHVQPQPQPQSQTHPHPQPLHVTERAADKPASEYPFSWNAFYMCLLFGAFIASNANTNLAGHSLPQLSEEYRAESANVLKAVLASSPPDLTHPSAIAVSASAPQPSIAMDMTQIGASHGRPSTLDQLHDTLVLPSEDQERAQVFALNADQYNSLTTFEDDGAPFKAQPSNLQAALAAMRSNAAQHRVHAGEDVYSRSLMWERVPEKVIRDFRRMVQEYGGSPVKEEMMTF
jgi:hypothetical protein